MKTFKATSALLLAAVACALLGSPALAVRWQTSGGLPAGAGVDLFISRFRGNGRTPSVSFSADGTVGLLTLQKPTNAVFRTVDGGRTWTKITDASFVGVYVLTNTRWLAVGQLGPSFDERRGLRLFTGFPTATGFVWDLGLPRPNIAGAVAIDVRGVAPFDGGAFVLGSAVWEDGRGGVTDVDPSTVQMGKNATQFIWRYDVATNSFTEVLSNKHNKIGVGPGSGTPYVSSIGAASRNVAWAAWQGMIRGASRTDPAQYFDGQVTAWDGTRWTVIRAGSINGEIGFELFGLGPNQLWLNQLGVVLRYYNGQAWTELFPFIPGIGRDLRLSKASAPGSLVLLDSRAERVSESSSSSVAAEHVWRWDAGAGQFRYEQFKGPDGSGPGSVAVSTASSGLTVMVWARKSETQLRESIVDFKGQSYSTGGWGAIDSVVCGTNSTTTGPCSVVDLVALPTSAVLVSEEAGGVYYLA